MTTRRIHRRDLSLYVAAGCVIGGAALFAAPFYSPAARAACAALDAAAGPALARFLHAEFKLYRPAGDIRFLVGFVPAAAGGAYILSRFRGTGGALLAKTWRRWFVGVPFLGFTAWAAYLWFGAYHTQLRHADENTYLLQARTFSRGKAYAPLPPCERHTRQDPYEMFSDNRNFFFAPLEATTRGRWFSIYPPLYPALLALPVSTQSDWLVNPLLMAAAVLLLYYVARREYGEGVARTTFILAATSPYIYFNAATRISEPLFLALTAAFILALGGGQTMDRARLILAGAVAGAAFNTRELSTALIFPPLFILYCGARPGRLFLQGLGYLLVGAIPGIAAYLGYNALVTGHPLTPPRLYGVVRHFGFDPRWGFLTGLGATVKQLFDLNRFLLGWPGLSLLPAVYALIKTRGRFATAVIVCLGIHIAFHLFVRNVGTYYGPRYYLPLGGLLLILTALGLGRLVEKIKMLPGVTPERAHTFVTAVVAAGVIYNWGVFTPGVVAAWRDPPLMVGPGWNWPGVAEAAAACPHRPAAILLSPREMVHTSCPNSPFLDDDVILGRDQGPRNADFIAAFPERYTYTLDLSAPATERALLLIYEPGDKTKP